VFINLQAAMLQNVKEELDPEFAIDELNDGSGSNCSFGSSV